MALNIEPEDDSEDEIDDSKEIQVGCSSAPCQSPAVRWLIVL